jgi:hypothetical protein
MLAAIRRASPPLPELNFSSTVWSMFMRVLHIVGGRLKYGAGRGALYLHNALLSLDVNSRLVCLTLTLKVMASFLFQDHHTDGSLLSFDRRAKPCRRYFILDV